jgi:hypothetical protein
MPHKIAAFLSTAVGFIIIGAAALLYAQQLMIMPVKEFAPIGLSACASIGGLAGLCFGFARSCTTPEERDVPLYAGEKFFHSVLLIIQTLFLKFAEDGLLAVGCVSSSKWISGAVRGTATVIMFVVLMYGVYFAIYGFEALNDFLWKRYKKRWLDIRKK